MSDRHASSPHYEAIAFADTIKNTSWDNVNNPKWHNVISNIITSKFPDNPTVHFEYARRLLQIGQHEKAIPHLGVAIQNIEQESRPHFLASQIIITLNRHGFCDAAQQLNERWAPQYPNDNFFRKTLTHSH